MGDIQHATRKGDNMRHDETRDNTTAIEAVMMAGDAEEILVELGHSPEDADRMVNGDADMTPVDMDNPREGVFPAVVTREDAPAKILPVIVTVDELPRLACDYPKPYNPQHVVDGVAVEDAPAKLHQGLGGIEGSDKTGRETWDERCQRMAEEAEDDGQPDEYTEWQDYMGGDEYYDHSENACW